jgi:hypothetical protein
MCSWPNCFRRRTEGGAPECPRSRVATWGFSKEEALRNLQDAVEAYVRDGQQAGGEIPKEASAAVRDEPLVAVTV